MAVGVSVLGGRVTAGAAVSWLTAGTVRITGVTVEFNAPSLPVQAVKNTKTRQRRNKVERFVMIK
jgi:hypothetical protein